MRQRARHLRAVSRGEELRFTYTDVPREWNDDAEIEAMMGGLHRLNVTSTDVNGGGIKRNEDSEMIVERRPGPWNQLRHWSILAIRRDESTQ